MKYVCSILQQKLTELRQWSEKVRNFDRYFQTTNGLFFVDCSHIHDNLLPRLKDIYDELITFVAEEARSLANSFCDDMKLIISVSCLVDSSDTVLSHCNLNLLVINLLKLGKDITSGTH